MEPFSQVQNSTGILIIFFANNIDIYLVFWNHTGTSLEAKKTSKDHN